MLYLANLLNLLSSISFPTASPGFSIIQSSQSPAMINVPLSSSYLWPYFVSRCWVDSTFLAVFCNNEDRKHSDIFLSLTQAGMVLMVSPYVWHWPARRLKWLTFCRYLEFKSTFLYMVMLNSCHRLVLWDTENAQFAQFSFKDNSPETGPGRVVTFTVIPVDLPSSVGYRMK